MLAGLETDAKRTVYLEEVWNERGEETARALRAAVWERMRAHGAAPAPQQEALAL
jgi:hypothetical protein